MTVAAAMYLIAPLVGLGAILIGFFASFWPGSMSKLFGIPANGAALPYVSSTGVRDVFIGFTVLILYERHQWAILGLIHFLIGVVALSDFYVVQKYGNKKISLTHLGGALAALLYGAWLVS